MTVSAEPTPRAEEASLRRHWSEARKHAETSDMRLVCSIFVSVLAISGCAVSAGAGVGARLGEPPALMSADCDSFEACDLVYEQALANAQHCLEEDDDCRAEERNVALSYDVLREQTRRELAELRNQAEEREAALERAERAAEAARSSADCTGHSRPLEAAPVSPRHGSGWFESEPPPAAIASHSIARVAEFSRRFALARADFSVHGVWVQCLKSVHACEALR